MKNSMSTILPSFGIWSKLERWKSSISRCLMSWPQIKKIVLLKCCLCLFYTTTTNHFLIKLRCAMKIGFYMTTGDDQLNGWTEKKLQSTTQSQTSTKNRSWSWWSAACLIHYSFLNPGKTITSEKYAQPVDEMHQKRQCLQPALVTRRARFPPDDAQLHTAASASKVARIGLPSFASSAIFTCPLANWLPLLQASLQLFAGKMLL